MPFDMKEAVRQVLPSLSEELLDGVVKKMIEDGVDLVTDLQFVQEADLSGLLRPIQCRKLLQAWKAKGK